MRKVGKEFTETVVKTIPDILKNALSWAKDNLYRQIGQLKVALDWLNKKAERVG